MAQSQTVTKKVVYNSNSLDSNPVFTGSAWCSYKNWDGLFSIFDLILNINALKQCKFEAVKVLKLLPKGQLISKCPFDVIFLTKNQKTNNSFKDFCLSL